MKVVLELGRKVVQGQGRKVARGLGRKVARGPGKKVVQEQLLGTLGLRQWVVQSRWHFRQIHPVGLGWGLVASHHSRHGMGNHRLSGAAKKRYCL